MALQEILVASVTDFIELNKWFASYHFLKFMDTILMGQVFFLKKNVHNIR